MAAARNPGGGRQRVACAAAAGTPGPLHWLRSELGTRLGVTLLLIVLARVGHFVPLPGRVLFGSPWAVAGMLRCSQGTLRGAGH